MGGFRAVSARRIALTRNPDAMYFMPFFNMKRRLRPIVRIRSAKWLYHRHCMGLLAWRAWIKVGGRLLVMRLN